MSTQRPTFAGQVPPDVKIAIAAARFNEHIVEKLLEGCQTRLEEMGVGAERVEVHRVPGAFELPLAAKMLARTKRFGAVICLGAVVRGETPHFEYVSGECARGIAEVNRTEMVPVIFGVLTTNDERQAMERCGGAHGHAGVSAAEAALEMVLLGRGISAAG